MVQNVREQLHGVGAVHLERLAGHLLQQVVEHLGVGLLLVGGEGEHALQHVEVLLPGQPGGEGVAVAGLALAGEGPHQVEPGLALVKGNGHGDPSC